MKPGILKLLFYACVSVWFVAAMVGGLSSESAWGIQKSGALLCPQDTTPGHTTYQQSVTDSQGHTTQDTAWILQCKDANGALVKEDANYMFPWIGIMLGAGILLTLPVLLAVLIASLVNRSRNRTSAMQIGRP